MNQTENFHTVKTSVPKLYRFQLYLGEKNENGKIQKSKIVGMSYLAEGHGTYTLRLWTFLNTNFYMVMSKTNASDCLLMSKEANKNEYSKTKHHWNVIGNGKVNATQNCIELNFDLFEKPIYMSIFPESNTTPSGTRSNEHDLSLVS